MYSSELYLLELKLDCLEEVLHLNKLWIVPVGIETLKFIQLSNQKEALNCTCWNWNFRQLCRPICIWISSELYLLELKHASCANTSRPSIVSELYLLELKPACAWWIEKYNCSELYLLELKQCKCSFSHYSQGYSELYLLELKLKTLRLNKFIFWALNCTCWNWNLGFYVPIWLHCCSELYLLELKQSQSTQSHSQQTLWIVPVGIETLLWGAWFCISFSSELYLLELKLAKSPFATNSVELLWIVPVGIETCLF